MAESEPSSDTNVPQPQRMTMPQDIRYATEPSDHEKLLEKYQNYEVSETDTCLLRFLLDRRQKKLLAGSSEEENPQALEKKFDVKLSPGYQQATKHSFKLCGTEKNVRQCLIELLERIFREPSPKKDEEPAATSVFVTTINPDASVSQETKSVEPEELKYVPVERKPEFTFHLLISSAGQEVLKKNWSLFGGALQQRLNVAVASPVRLAKFGDRQVFCELPITGDSMANLTDASLQIQAFVNDVLGVVVQPLSSSADRPRKELVEEKLLLRSDCVARIVGKRGANLRLIKNKSHLTELNIGREADENGYIPCQLTATQSRNIQTAIEMIRNFLRHEDSKAVIVGEPTGTGAFSAKAFPTDSTTFSQPSFNFQNPPSFDFTHQATSAARKTDKRPGDLSENSPQAELEPKVFSASPKHRTKRTCPVTKEINCSTDEGFWIEKQFYHALDDESKGLFDSLIDKLEKIRLAAEENAARKHQRFVGRNRPSKSRTHASAISQSNEENQPVEKPLSPKWASTETNEEKENQQEPPAEIVQAQAQEN